MDDRLRTDVGVDRPSKTIVLPSGHDFPTAHRLACRALLYVVGGADWAEEFTDPAPGLRILRTPPDTLPLARRVW